MKAPWSEKGLIAEPKYSWDKFEWRETEPFYADLTYVETYRSRSAVRIIWQTPDGTKLPMFLSDFSEMLPKVHLYNGVVEGQWEVVNRSGYYGIRLCDV